MSHKFVSGGSDLDSLSEEISHIYRNYQNRKDQTDPPQQPNSLSLGNISSDGNHILQSAFNGDSSRGGTPISTSSFDFTDNNGMTNSSLNVLNTPPQTRSAVSVQHPQDEAPPSKFSVQHESRLATGESIDDYSKYDSTDSSRNYNEWVEKGAAQARRAGPDGETVVRRTVEDFEFGKDLGEGSYSTVVLATDKITSRKYAIKVLDKRHIIKEKKVKYVNIEKHALNRLSRQNGIISLFYTFQDKNSLYFVLDYASNGELLGLIKQYGTLNEDCTKYLGAQILDAIHNMHSNGIIHRDIKPENILLDDKFRIRITDFGTAKMLERKVNDTTGEQESYPMDVRAKSFVGTAEYVSPELLENKYCGKPGDIWAFGCILYQMIAGKPPFKAANEYLTFQKITKLQYAFSAGFPSVLRDLLKQILVLQPSRRATIKQIKEHYFFENFDFDDPNQIWNSTIPELGPYKMNAKSMMKVPAKQPPKQAKKANMSPVPRKVSAENQGTPKTKTPQTPKNFSAASVAAYVLAKDDDVAPETAVHKTPPTSAPKASTPSRSTPDYIPGTKILRPQINTMSSYTKSSVSSSVSGEKDPNKRRPSKVMEVTPSTAVEAAWQQYLNSSERVINVGSALVRKQPIAMFERKFKGLIHDAPLGFANRTANQRKGSRSMMSQVVQGNKMKDWQESSSRSNSLTDDDAIKIYPDDKVEETEANDAEDKSSSVATSSAKIGKSLFKKLLPNSEKKEVSPTASTNKAVAEDKHVTMLEKARTYTVLVTTHGRVLLFLRDDHRTDYKIICEIHLQYPFIRFKEVVTNTSSKFGKMIPVTGMFAIVTTQTAFVFETEKYEVNQWTESLAKAQLNQVEREKEANNVQRAESTPKNSPRSPAAAAFTSSPKDGQAHKEHRDRHNPPTLREVSGDSPSRSEYIPSEGQRRKPPPTLESPKMVHKDHRHPRSQDETVYAAQLAVSNNANVHMPEYRRSSFTKDSNGASKTPAANGGPKVTSMNSKFLARSRKR